MPKRFRLFKDFSLQKLSRNIIINEYGYENVRGGLYANSITLQKKKKANYCYPCGRNCHYAYSCYAKYNVNGEYI